MPGLERNARLPLPPPRRTLAAFGLWFAVSAALFALSIWPGLLSMGVVRASLLWYLAATVAALGICVAAGLRGHRANLALALAVAVIGVGVMMGVHTVRAPIDRAQMARDA